MNTPPFGVGTSVVGEQRILTITGELDLAVCAPFEQALLAALAATRPGGELLVNLSDVPFFDVTAMRVLLRAARAAQAVRVPLDLIASPAVDRVFELVGIDLTHVLVDSPRRQIILDQRGVTQSRAARPPAAVATRGSRTAPRSVTAAS